MRHLVTGGSGFVGSHVVRHLLTNTDAHLVLPVTFTHRGNADRLNSAIADHPEWQKRMTIMYHDLRGPFSKTQIHQIGKIDTIFNLASDSHVDRSIEEPVPFIQNNVNVMLTMLELARRIGPRMFIQISTDEVYGPAYEENHAEWAMILPSNPYSGSKAAQEAIAISYWRTYGVPLVLTNTMNIIGEMQDPEKFVPLSIGRLRVGQSVPVHVAPDGTPGSRFYLHARNQADALLFLSKYGIVQRYPEDHKPLRLNIVGEREVTNTEMVQLIASIMRVPALIKPESFHASRPGHDLRYALDGRGLAKFGWKAPIPFEESLERTVRWTLSNPQWLL